MNLDSLRRTAAEIAAIALTESYPNVELLGGGNSSWGFYYEALFPHPLHPEFHLQMEERMRQIVREKRDISDAEMVPWSAAELFKSLGRLEKARQILEQDGLVPVVRIGSFVDTASGKHRSNTAALSAFKLFPTESLGEGKIRIVGTAHETKEELKIFLKRWAAYAKERHEVRGATEGLWERQPEGWVWLPRGVALREKIIHFFTQQLAPSGAAIRTPSGADRRFLYKKFLERTQGTSVIEIVAVSAEEVEDCGLLQPVQWERLEIASVAISPLQCIGKTLNMLGFSYSIRLLGSSRGEKGFKALFHALEGLSEETEVVLEEGAASQINFLIADGLGRMWSAVTVVVDARVGLAVMQVPIERNAALILERGCFETMR